MLTKGYERDTQKDRGRVTRRKRGGGFSLEMLEGLVGKPENVYVNRRSLDIKWSMVDTMKIKAGQDGYTVDKDRRGWIDIK